MCKLSVSFISLPAGVSTAQGHHRNKANANVYSNSISCCLSCAQSISETGSTSAKVVPFPRTGAKTRLVSPLHPIHGIPSNMDGKQSRQRRKSKGGNHTQQQQNIETRIAVKSRHIQKTLAEHMHCGMYLSPIVVRPIFLWPSI